MSVEASSSTSGLSDRVQLAYDPNFLQRAGDELIGLLASHLDSLGNRGGNVLNWRDPRSNIDAAAKQLETPDASLAKFVELAKQILSSGQNLHHPRYIGHQVPASVPLAGLFDAIGSVTNQVMAIYEMGPWATAVERSLVETVGKQIGFADGTFDGLVTHGGSLANLTGLLTARNVSLGDAWDDGLTNVSGKVPVLVCHQHAHYSVARSAGVLGLGTDNIVRVNVDDRGRMCPESLRTTLAKLRDDERPVVAVCACACATPIGAFDPLNDIADVCEQFGVWLHVDAAHGGAAVFSDRQRHLVAGLERADSVVVDAHKMMFMPALCAFVFYRNRDHRYEAFQQEAPYLFDPTAPGMAEFDSGMKTLECTKRAATFGLWGIWSMFGPELFADLVDLTFSLGQSFHQMLNDAEDFEPLHTPQCNIVVFRYLPSFLRDKSAEAIGDFQLKLRRDVIESGKFYIVPIKPDGVGALRVTVINPLTTRDDLAQLMDTLRELGTPELIRAE